MYSLVGLKIMSYLCFSQFFRSMGAAGKAVGGRCSLGNYLFKIQITVMKKLVVLGLCVGAVMALSSCKSKESAYKKAYEEARKKQTTVVEEENPAQMQTPVEVTPLVPTTPTTDVSNVSVRTENVTVVSGAGLKSYSVVCGSFGVKANAERLQATLAGAGYTAQIVYNAGINMYRVVASTYADKASAVQSRDTLRGQYPDAWLLYTK